MCGRVVLYISFVVWGGSVIVQPTLAQQTHRDTLSLTEIIKTSLVHNPTGQLQEQQVQLQRGLRLAASAAFDSRLQISVTGNRENRFSAGQLGEHSEALSEVASNAAGYQFGFSKQFRSGLAVQPRLQVDHTHTLKSGLEPTNQVDAGVTLRYPLLRGQGAEADVLREQATHRNYQASEFEHRTVAADIASQTTQAFWEFIAARALLDIARQSEERAATLLQETEILVEKDERPAADLDQLKAHLIDKQNGRVQAEQTLMESKQRLGVIMGISAQKVGALTVADQDFPDVPDQLLDRLPSTSRYVAIALEERDELVVAQYKQQAASNFRDAAREQLKPRLDLALDVGYAGLGRGAAARQFLSPFGQEVEGVNLSLTLSTDLSLQNRAAEGHFAQQEAAYRQQVIEMENLKRTIRLNVETTVSAFRSSVRQRQMTQRATELHRSAVENEKRKYQLGASTLLDVMLAEDRLTNSLMAHVRNQHRYAVMLVQLRFRTGTLLEFEGDSMRVSDKRFLTVPEIAPD